MKTFTVERLPDEPIIYSWVSESWTTDELSSYVEEVIALLDAVGGPVIYISDAREANLNVQDIIIGASTIARGTNTLLHHPNLKECVQVSASKLLQLAAKGMDSDIFGNVKVKICETYDEALAYARARIDED
jgi:hypothetical protein